MAKYTSKHVKFFQAPGSMTWDNLFLTSFVAKHMESYLLFLIFQWIHVEKP